MTNLIQSTLILIAVLMSRTGAENVIYAQVGETVTLKPPEGTNFQNYYLYWFFGDHEIAWRNIYSVNGVNTDGNWPNVSLSGGSLIVKTIQHKHFRTFSCKLMSKGGKIVDVVTYKLLKLDMLMNPPSPLLPGESLSLVCNAESPQSHKKPEIHWLNPQGEKMKTSQGKFTMTASGQCHGQWTCVVTNDEKINKAKISVTVVDLSPAPLHPQYTSKSSPLTIPCSIPSHISWEQIKVKGIQGGHWHFFPKSSSSLIPVDPQRLFSLSLEDPVAWKAEQDRGLTPAPDFKKGNLSLTRNQGREEDRGDYVCTLQFQNSATLNRTVHVNVLQIISSPRTDFISGQQVNLTCSLGFPLPSDLRLKWFPPEQSSLQSVTSDHHSAHLTIPEVGTGDGGNWRCELWQSNTRLTWAVITLKIEPKLSVWMLVIICSVTVSVILLLILVVILYRRRQQKTRRLRHRLCQCKNPKPKGFYRS